jgi:hypothetical protein
MLACLSDDVAHDINQGERQVGKDTFRAFIAHMERCYRERLDDIVLMANEDGTRARRNSWCMGNTSPRTRAARSEWPDLCAAGGCFPHHRRWPDHAVDDVLQSGRLDGASGRLMAALTAHRAGSPSAR